MEQKDNCKSEMGSIHPRMWRSKSTENYSPILTKHRKADMAMNPLHGVRLSRTRQGYTVQQASRHTMEKAEHERPMIEGVLTAQSTSVGFEEDIRILASRTMSDQSGRIKGGGAESVSGTLGGRNRAKEPHQC